MTTDEPLQAFAIANLLNKKETREQRKCRRRKMRTAALQKENETLRQRLEMVQMDMHAVETYNRLLRYELKTLMENVSRKLAQMSLQKGTGNETTCSANGWDRVLKP